MLAGKLHHASVVIPPERYFGRRLLQLSHLHLGKAEQPRGRAEWGRNKIQYTDGGEAGFTAIM